MPSDGCGRESERVRFEDAALGRGDVLGTRAALERLRRAVLDRLDDGRGVRFPLLRLVAAKEFLGAAECDALAREIARLRAALASVSVDALRLRPLSRSSDPALDAAAPLEPFDEPFPRPAGAPAPSTLADAFAWPFSVLESVARIGAATRRGARFVSVADASPADEPVRDVRAG